MRRSISVVTFVAVGSLVAAACGGGDDDSSDVLDAVQEQVDDAASDLGGGSEDDGELSEGGAVFGDLLSGTISFSGPEAITYFVEDPAYDFFGAGGCGGSDFGISVNATEVDTGYTVFQLDAGVEADLNGGGTGTFEVEEMSLVALTDGDFTSSRTYRGPGTITITEHDTGGADNVLNERRMAITLEGALEGSEDAGTVDVSANFVWVMGCP